MQTTTNSTISTVSTETNAAPEPADTIEATTPVQRDRLKGERGEGVISTAIAVLIIAFLGAGMWVGFKAIFDEAVEDTRVEMDSLGR